MRKIEMLTVIQNHVILKIWSHQLLNEFLQKHLLQNQLIPWNDHNKCGVYIYIYMLDLINLISFDSFQA